METAIEQTYSETMRDALWKLERVAPSDLSVIIIGERGAGKEWAARIVHQASARARGPFYPVDCSALGSENIERELFGYENISWEGIEIKKGAFEEAAGGTLFLHEMTAIPIPTQLRIARAIEYKHFRRIAGEQDLEINFRLVASMFNDPDSPEGVNELHEDFRSRIAAVSITIPPLRERKTDIPILVDRFIAELRDRYGSTVKGISREAMHLCVEYTWPGNVRHLRNAIEYASIMCGDGNIMPEHLPEYLRTRKTANGGA